MSASAIKSLNFVADSTTYVMKNSGRIVIPTALGAVGGWLAGVGCQKGAFQGLVAGVLMSWVLTPVGNYIDQNSGEGENQIHSNTKDLLRVTGAVVAVMGPILTTKYLSGSVLGSASMALPMSAKWLVASDVTKEYTLYTGFMVNIAPALTQYGIECLRSKK